MDEPEAVGDLQPYQVLGADGVGAPQRLVEVLAVPAAELGGAVVDVVEGTTALDDALDLPELAHVTARVQRHFHVGAQAEADLVRLVVQVAGHHMVAAGAEIRDEAGPHGAEAARH